MLEICGKQVRVHGRMVRVAQLEGELYVSLGDPARVLESLRHSGEADLFTFMQMPPETSPKYNFPMEIDNLAVLDISTFEHWWKEQIGKKTRNMVRQAEKRGVSVHEVEFDEKLVRGIWGIYNEAPVRQGRPFPHYGKDLETIHRITATFLDTSVFVGAYFEDELIGFIKLTANEKGTQAGTMNIVSMLKHRDKAPTNALIAEAVRACSKRAIPHLIYSTFAYGDQKRDGLMEFKERNGFHRVDLPRYYVPLTGIGRAALRLGLHHGLMSHVPESILAKLREWRGAWYKHKFRLEEAV